MLFGSFTADQYVTEPLVWCSSSTSSSMTIGFVFFACLVFGLIGFSTTVPSSAITYKLLKCAKTKLFCVPNLIVIALQTAVKKNA